MKGLVINGRDISRECKLAAWLIFQKLLNNCNIAKKCLKVIRKLKQTFTEYKLNK